MQFRATPTIREDNAAPKKINWGYFMFKAFIDKFPPDLTMMAGAFLFIAPIMPEPHLVQKAMWLMDGMPFKPIDVFDVLLHGSAGVLAVSVFLRQRELRAQAQDEDA